MSDTQKSREERIALLEKIIEIYQRRMPDLGAAVSSEMGAPISMAVARRSEMRSPRSATNGRRPPN